MRTRPLVAAAALIAAVVLAAQPGPAGSQVPTPDRPIDTARLRPLVLERPMGNAATSSPTLDPDDRAAGATLDDPARDGDPGLPPVPDARPDIVQPDSPLGTVVKPTPTPAPTPRPTPAPERVVAAAPAGPSVGAPASTPEPTPAAGWTWDPEASWYGPGFYGRRTACGHAYTTEIQGVAHRSLPCGTRVTFRNPANGRTITVPVIDRGPYVAGRTWDLSGATCTALDHCYTGPIQWRYP